MMHKRLIGSDPEIAVYATESGDVVLEQVMQDQGSSRCSVRIPHEKIHQATVWMRRIAAEFDGLRIPLAAGDDSPQEGRSYLAGRPSRGSD